MNKITFIKTASSDWKKALDDSDDTFWMVFKNTAVQVESKEECKALYFDFQKGFQPKSLEVNGKVFTVEKNSSNLEILLKPEESLKVDVLFKDSYDPYGRIFIYRISTE